MWSPVRKQGKARREALETSNRVERFEFPFRQSSWIENRSPRTPIGLWKKADLLTKWQKWKNSVTPEILAFFPSNLHGTVCNRYARFCVGTARRCFGRFPHTGLGRLRGLPGKWYLFCSKPLRISVVPPGNCCKESPVIRLLLTALVVSTLGLTA